MANKLPGFFEGTGMPGPGWWEALWPDPAKVLRDVGVTPCMDVVDLCSGDGWFTFPLSKIARHVLAIDIDRKLLDAAKVRFDERGGAPNVTFVEADVSGNTFGRPSITSFLLTPFTACLISRASRRPSMIFLSPAVFSRS